MWLNSSEAAMIIMIMTLSKDMPHPLALPQPVDHHDQQDAEKRAHAGRLGGRGDPAVEHIEDADDDGEERQDLGQDLEPLAQREAPSRVAEAPAAPPRHEQRPADEEQRQHQSGHYPG